MPVRSSKTRWPDVVAIDSPPGWGSSGRTREAERDLHRRGISIFWTPEESVGVTRKDLRWMQEGFAYFRAAAAAGYPTFTRRASMEGKALEVFPHASACGLSGHLRPAGVSKVRFRRDVLRARGVEVDALTNIDKVDAALAAMTGVIAVEGDACAVGCDDEGLIVVPVPRLHVRYTSAGS